MGKTTSNAAEILRAVENRLDILEHNTYMKGFKIDDVYEELSIFDWWVDTLSKSRLKDMKKFLEEAIKLGYTGYVCFKVGATGCSNGMWAHKNESTDGYSPDGEFLYKSFTPAYNYWSVQTAEGKLIPEDKEYDSVKTIRQLEELVKEIRRN